MLLSAINKKNKKTKKQKKKKTDCRTHFYSQSNTISSDNHIISYCFLTVQYGYMFIVNRNIL